MSSLFSRRATVMILIGALAVIVTAVGAFSLHRGLSSQSSSATSGLAGGPIELASTHGDFSLTQLDNNQVAIVSFGYTYCPDVCPMTQAVKKQALAVLTPQQRERIVPLMISVDPQRDSLERLTQYTGFFGERFIGATGTQQQLEELAKRYGVIWRRAEAENSAMGYTIDHSSSLYVVDREGKILDRVPYSTNPEGLVTALNTALGS